MTDLRLTPGRPSPATATRAGNPDHDPILNAAKGQNLYLDLETRGNDVQWTDAPGTHVKLGSYIVGNTDVRLTTGGPALTVGPNHTLLDLLLVAKSLVGHGIMNYDLVVLAHQYPDLFPTPWKLAQDHGKILWDTQLVESLIDPPEARWKEGEAQRHYKLENVAQRRGFPAGKSLDLAKVAKLYGGFEHIPWDDPVKNVDLLEYARQDVRLVRDLATRQARQIRDRYEYVNGTPQLRNQVGPDYVRREHLVAAIAAQITLNGFRVDTALLQKRVIEGEVKKAGILEELRSRYGLPSRTKDGKHEAKSPQATKAGKQAILDAFVDAGMNPDTFPRKEKSGDPDLSKDTMATIIERGTERQKELAEAIMSLNGVRNLYGQIQESLVGDRVHPNISFRQASGRWSFTRPGLTVVGKRGGRIVERDVFIADPGHVILTADLSQVDARVVAAFSQDPGYLALFGEGRDLWNELSQRFGIDRNAVKIVAHGSNYGQGPKGIVKHNPTIPYAEAVRFQEEMRQQFPGLEEWKNRVRRQGEKGILLDNGWGRKLRVNPDRAYTQAPALSGQSGARDVMMQGLLNLCGAHPETLTMLRAVVHDEVVMSVPFDISEDVAYEVNKAMTFLWYPFGDENLLPVQIKAEATVGKRTWASAYGK